MPPPETTFPLPWGEAQKAIRASPQRASSGIDAFPPANAPNDPRAMRATHLLVQEPAPVAKIVLAPNSSYGPAVSMAAIRTSLRRWAALLSTFPSLVTISATGEAS